MVHILAYLWQTCDMLSALFQYQVECRECLQTQTGDVMELWWKLSCCQILVEYLSVWRGGRDHARHWLDRPTVCVTLTDRTHLVTYICSHVTYMCGHVTYMCGHVTYICGHVTYICGHVTYICGHVIQTGLICLVTVQVGGHVYTSIDLSKRHLWCHPVRLKLWGTRHLAMCTFICSPPSVSWLASTWHNEANADTYWQLIVVVYVHCVQPRWLHYFKAALDFIYSWQHYVPSIKIDEGCPMLNAHKSGMQYDTTRRPTRLDSDTWQWCLTVTAKWHWTVTLNSDTWQWHLGGTINSDILWLHLPSSLDYIVYIHWQNHQQKFTQPWICFVFTGGQTPGYASVLSNGETH